MKTTMLYNPKPDEKMRRYSVIYVDRKTGEQENSSLEMSLYDAEVIDKQIELSTATTAVMLKLI